MEDKKKKPNKIIVWIFIGVGIFCTLAYFASVVLLVFSIDQGIADIEYNNGSIIIDNGKLSIDRNINSQLTEGGYIIDGYIKNNTKKKLEYISLTFTVMDSEGNILGTAYSNINMLDANKTWRFKAVYNDFDYATAISFELLSVEYS